MPVTRLGGILRFQAMPFIFWFIVLFHAGWIGDRDLQRSMTVTASTTATWSTWGPWSDCNTLDVGRRTRLRHCTDSNGKTHSSNCAGLERRTRLCESCDFPLNPGRRQNSHSGSAPSFSSSTFTQTSSRTAWCSSKSASSDTEYLEIAFKNFIRLTGIATRGYKGTRSGYVKEYKLKYSYNGVHWFSYTNRGKDVIFKGNVDAIRQRQNKLEGEIAARYVRVYPTSYQSRLCLAVELYGCEYNCGGLITDDSVHIKAPNADQTVEEPHCLWRIEPPLATKLQLKFPHFNLVCRDGILELFDGRLPFMDADEVEAYCGSSTKIPPLTFIGSDLWVYFRTNATTHDVGFQLRANIFAVTTLNSSAGEITVPESGEGYAHIYRRLWIIVSRQPNTTIELTIHQFISTRIHHVDDKCIGDMLVVKEGENPVSPIGRYCDDRFPKVITSSRGHLQLKFRSKSDKPGWKLRFSYKILGLQSPSTSYDIPTVAGRTTVLKRTVRGTVRSLASAPRNDTEIEATYSKEPEKGSSKVPAIVASVLAFVIAVVFLIALVHYVKRRKEFMKKHPYDCSNRPMSHFGDEDSTPFLNTNVLMWGDSNSRNHEKEKQKNGKKALPFVSVTFREDGPQRLSIIPPEMVTANSQQSLEKSIDDENTAGSLVVSDAFTEECMQLLDTNLSTALHGENSEKVDEESGNDENALEHAKDEAFGYSSADDDSQPETDVVEGQRSLNKGHLSEVSE